MVHSSSISTTTMSASEPTAILPYLGQKSSILTGVVDEISTRTLVRGAKVPTSVNDVYNRVVGSPYSGDLPNLDADGTFNECSTYEHLSVDDRDHAQWRLRLTYHLVAKRCWRPERDSDPRPTTYEAAALTAELPGHSIIREKHLFLRNTVRLGSGDDTVVDEFLYLSVV